MPPTRTHAHVLAPILVGLLPVSDAAVTRFAPVCKPVPGAVASGHDACPAPEPLLTGPCKGCCPNPATETLSPPRIHQTIQAGVAKLQYVGRMDGWSISSDHLPPNSRPSLHPVGHQHAQKYTESSHIAVARQSQPGCLSRTVPAPVRDAPPEGLHCGGQAAGRRACTCGEAGCKGRRRGGPPPTCSWTRGCWCTTAATAAGAPPCRPVPTSSGAALAEHPGAALGDTHPG